MYKTLTWLLIVLVCSNISSQSAAAAIGNNHLQAAKAKLIMESISPGTSVRAKLKDHRQIEGQLVARSEDGFELAAPDPFIIRYAELSKVSFDPRAQSVPTGGQNPPVHRGHFARIAVIIVVLGAVLLIVLAAAAKK